MPGSTLLCGPLSACGSGASGTNISGNWLFLANGTASKDSGSTLDATNISGSSLSKLNAYAKKKRNPFGSHFFLR